MDTRMERMEMREELDRLDHALRDNMGMYYSLGYIKATLIDALMDLPESYRSVYMRQIRAALKQEETVRQASLDEIA